MCFPILLRYCFLQRRFIEAKYFLDVWRVCVSFFFHFRGLWSWSCDWVSHFGSQSALVYSIYVSYVLSDSFEVSFTSKGDLIKVKYFSDVWPVYVRVFFSIFKIYRFKAAIELVTLAPRVLCVYSIYLCYVFSVSRYFSDISLSSKEDLIGIKYFLDVCQECVSFLFHFLGL